MRRIGIALVILLTGYFAGIYRNEPLMIMAVTEVLLVIAMRVLSILLKGSLSIGFVSDSGEAVRGSNYSCGVAIRNKGLLPVSRFCLSLLSGYEGGKKKTETIYGGILKGEQRLSVDVDCRHCGIARVSAEKVKVYDYLSLFSSQKRIGRSMVLTVYPQEMAAEISLAGLKEARQAIQSGTVITPYAGGNDEIRLIREYREGDSVRHVHWNLTARMDELWVREYNSERDVPLRFFIDLTGLGAAGGGSESAGPGSRVDDAADSFFGVLNALLLGLLADAGCIRVMWRGSDIFGDYEENADGAVSAMDIRSQDDCRELLRRLYLERLGDPEPMTLRMTSNGMPDEAGSLISLDTGLNWRVDGQLVWHFSATGYEEELRSNIFEL